MYNTKMFAEKVMPNIRDIWGDWEDKWWIKPMQNRQVPKPMP
jgi:hypothetical protein